MFIVNLATKQGTGKRIDYEEEFTLQFKECQGLIYKIAYTYTRNSQDSLDIVQETAYKSFLNYSKLKNIESFKAWVCRIAVNEAINLLKKNKQCVDIEEVAEICATEEESKNSFLDLLFGLNENQKTIVLYKIYFDYTFAQIAKETKVPEATVKTNYYRAIEKLRLEEGVAI